MSAAIGVMPAVNLADLDLHVNTYNSVEWLSANLKEFDDYMGDAETNELAAFQAGDELTSGQDNIAQSVSDASGAAPADANDPFAAAAGTMEENMAASTTTVQKAVDALTSANQPLSVLQQTLTPAQQEQQVQDQANAEMASYLHNYNNAPQAAQAQMQTPEEYDQTIEAQEQEQIAQIEAEPQSEGT
jgi:hypothetical protein